jgi:hypothetical protein
MCKGVTLAAPSAERSVVCSLRSQHAYSSIRFSPILNVYRPFALADHRWLPAEETAVLLLFRIPDSIFNSGGLKSTVLGFRMIKILDRNILVCQSQGRGFESRLGGFSSTQGMGVVCVNLVDITSQCLESL